MKRREFLKSAVTCAAVAAAPVLPAAKKSAGVVRGKVAKGGKNGGPAVGVVVTDGLQCVRTDEHGEFEIPARKGARFVSVTVPSGYRCADFYSPIASSLKSHFFRLSPWKPSAKKGCKFVHIADSEVGGMHETDWVEDVKRVADNDGAAFIVHTGDICRYRGMRTHLLTMNAQTMGRPVIYCLGNHDMTPGAAGETYFEAMFGPCWRSFEAGGIHFVVTPMPKGDFKPSYTMDEVADWVRNDLAMVPKGMPVVFFNHMLTNAKDENAGFTIGEKRFDISKACNFTGFVYGHLHQNHFQRRGKTALICSVPPQMGGIGLSPATLRTIRADAKGRLDSEIIYGAPEKPKPNRAGAVWETKLPGKVLFCAPVVENGRVFVGTSDDEGCGNACVAALDAKSGGMVWSQPMVNSVNNKIVCAKGLVIAQDIEGRVRAFDQKSGNMMWCYEPPVHAWKIILNGLSYDAETGIVFVGNGKRMAALDAATGKAVWKDAGWGDRGEACADTPGIGEGCIVSSGNWEGMFCNDVKTGRLLWSVIDGTRRFPGATPFIKDGRIYTLAAASYLEIDLKTGKTVREKKLPSGAQVTTRVLVTDRHLIFGTAKAGLLALDRNTLDVAWKGAVGAALAPFAAYSKRPQRCVGTIPVLMPNGTVCASSSDGAIHFWRESDGKHLKEFRTNAPYFADVALAEGRIFAADSEGYIRAFDVV